MPKIKSIIENITSKQFALLVLVLSFVLYGNTLNHDYALDDAIVLTKNEFTKQGIKGIPDILKHDSFTGFFGKEKKLVEGGRYRPLSIITFAIEYSMWGETPLASHLINILLYGLIALIAFKLTISLFTERLGNSSARIIAFIASIIFLVHPVHTEAVANIKGRDELLTLLFALSAFYVSIQYTNKQKPILLLASGLFLFFGLMAKENAITFIAIIPLGVLFFKSQNPKTIALIFVPLFISSAIFLYIRYQVLGGLHNSGTNELMNNPFVAATLNEKYATIMYTWLVYYKLLIFPHPLTYDYYPYHIELINFTNPIVLVSMLITLSLLTIAFLGMMKKSVLSFCILSFFASFSIVSNLLFSVGTFMNERFIFIPSLFWCIGLAYLIVIALKRRKKITQITILALIILIIASYSAKGIVRNKAWKNDLTLFTTDVKTSYNSAKSNCSAGGKLWEEAKSTTNTDKQNEYYALSEKYLNRAIEIHPDYTDALLLLGNLLYDYKRNITSSVDCYIEVLKRQPANENAWNNADLVLQNHDNKPEQLQLYLELNRINSNRYMINYRIGVIHGRYLNNLDKGISYLEKAHEINPTGIDALKDLGTAYGIEGNAELAYTYSKKAHEIDNTDYQIYVNLGLAASALGKTEEAKRYFDEAQKLKAIKN